MAIDTNYLENTPLKDLNLDLTTADLNTLDTHLNDESKEALKLDALTSLGQANATNFQVQSADVNATAVQATQQAADAPPTTTINPLSILGATRNYVKANDPFSGMQEYMDPRKTPLSEIRRYSPGDFKMGEDVGPGFVYGRNNEDFAAQNEGFWTNLGKGLVRLPMSIGIKTGQTIGFLEGLVNPTNWGDGYLQNASHNAITEAFNQLDDAMKNQLLPVYQKAESEGKGFWWKATHDMNFWTNDFVDGAAFMISAFAPGAILSKVGFGTRLARGLSAFKWGANAAETAVEGAATAENYLANAQKIWATRTDRVAQWALSVAGESMFEATETGENIKKGLTYDENGLLRINPDTGLPYTEDEKKKIAGSHMKNSFFANAAILSVSNAMELQWIRSMTGRAEKKALTEGLTGGTKLGDALAFNLEKQGIAKFLNSSAGRFTKAVALGTLTEGFYEENVQLAIQRVNEQYGVEGKMAQFKDYGKIAFTAAKQAGSALVGKDPEASLSIGLGGLLGGPMKARADLKEFKQNKAFTEAAVKFYNEAQTNWLKFGNIFETKTVTVKDKDGKETTEEQVILDDKGRPTVNMAKLTNVVNNLNNASSAVEAGNQTADKLRRDILRDNAWADFVKAHIDLGIENTLLTKLDAIGKTSPGELVKLGFTTDDTTQAQIEKYKSLTNLIIKQNKLLNDDIMFERNWKGEMLPVEQARRTRMMELATQQAVYKHLMSDVNSSATELKNEILKASKENTALSDDFVDQINSLQLRINAQRQYIEELGMSKDKAIQSAMAKTVLNDLVAEMDDLKKNNTETLKTLRKGEDGFYDYEKSKRNDPANKILRNMLYMKYAQQGQLANHVQQIGLEWAKYADTKNGKKNFTEYIDNVVTKPFTDAMERAERGKSSKLTDEEREQKRKGRQPKGYESRTPWVKKGTNATFLYRYKDDDRVSEDIIDYYDVQDGETAALAPLVQKIISNPYTDEYVKTILSKLLPFIKEDAKVKFDTKQTYAPAYYTQGTKTITVDPELHETKMSFEGVMLHEIIHLLTSDELAFDSKFTRDIEQLYEYAKKNLEDRGIDTAYYGFTNIHEFLAEAYSNPEFQKELQSVPGITGQKSIWEDFLDALSDFFKRTFNIEIKPSVLDDIFYKVEEYLTDTVYKEAVRQYKKNGLTQEEIDNYSKRELIDMAINDELISPDLVSKSRTYPEEEETNTPPPGPETSTGGITINQDIDYSYKGKRYGIFELGDMIHLINKTDPDDVFSFSTDEFKELMQNGQIKPAVDLPSQVPDTFEEYLENVYNSAKTGAESSGRTIPDFETWKKQNEKFEKKRYERLKNPPKPGETKEGEEKVDYAGQVKPGNQFTGADGNMYKIVSVIPGKTVAYVKMTPDNQTSLEKEPIEDFVKKLEDKTFRLDQTEFEETEDPNAVQDFVINDRFGKGVQNSTREDNNTANITFQEGRKQVSPHNSLANATDLADFELSGSEIRWVRKGVNTNYVFDVATGNFVPGASVVYRVMTSDFPEVVNRLTGEKYDKSKIFDADGKVKQSMFDYAPIGVYTVIDGKEKLIGTIHEPQWIDLKIADKYVNMVVPSDELDQLVPPTVKKELEKNRKLRNFILQNHNKDSKFEMNAIVEGKSIGVLRTLSQPGTLKERLNPKIGEGGTNNRHGMFGIVRNGEIQVGLNQTIDNVENTKSFTENIDKQSGVPVVLVPTPTGTMFPVFIKIPNVNKGQAGFIIDAWKAFTNQESNPELVKAVYTAMDLEMSEGKPDIGVLQNYINHYITVLESKPLSKIGGDTGVLRNTARLNITNEGHLYLQSKLGEQWFDNDGKPIVTANQLPSNIMDHLQNLLTTVKFTTKDRRMSGINSTKKIPFVTVEDGKMKVTSMTYNQYVMQGASTYVEEGIDSKNKDGDWVYFANPVVKMSTNTDSIVVETKTETEVGDKFETPPASVQTAAETSKETELTNKLNSIQKGSIGFSSKTQPGTVRYTSYGTKVEFVKSQRDKFGRGNEVYKVTHMGKEPFEVIVDYKQRPSGGFPNENEIVFQAKYSENPKEILEELRAVQDKAAETKPSEVNLDDIFGALDRVATANELTDEQVEEESKKCKTKGKK